jgi:N-acyl-D-aspartate/D-glutamate deacylase
VIANGKVIIEDGNFVGKKGGGRFLRRGQSLASSL